VVKSKLADIPTTAMCLALPFQWKYASAILPKEQQPDTYNHQLGDFTSIWTQRMTVNFEAVHAATVSPAE